MAGSVNKVILIGNVGNDPEIRNMQSGDKVANISLATSESWKDKDGNKQEKTQWHKVVVFNQNIIKVVENYVTKGTKLFIEGQIETRKWDNKEGVTQYITEVLIKPFNGSLTMLSGTSDKETQQETKEDDSGEIPY